MFVSRVSYIIGRVNDYDFNHNNKGVKFRYMTERISVGD